MRLLLWTSFLSSLHTILDYKSSLPGSSLKQTKQSGNLLRASSLLQLHMARIEKKQTTYRETATRIYILSYKDKEFSSGEGRSLVIKYICI